MLNNLFSGYPYEVINKYISKYCAKYVYHESITISRMNTKPRYCDEIADKHPGHQLIC
uniref:Uncharacterized protein n=1 Tax=Parascaris equorum TaxID=6256 RepID=A0A914S376_PAREQ